MKGDAVKEFFQPEDFDEVHRILPTPRDVVAASLANAKLKRHSKVVYVIPNNKECGWYEKRSLGLHYHQALLIGIQPIAKCEHKIEDVLVDHSIIDDYTFRCKCGVKVKRVIAYEEIK